MSRNLRSLKLVHVLPCLSAVAVACWAGPARATTGNWIAGAGNWSDGTKWSGGIPNGVGDTANFVAGGSVQGVTINGTFTVGIINTSGTGGGSSWTNFIGSGQLIFDNGASNAQVNSLSSSVGELYGPTLPFVLNTSLDINMQQNGGSGDYMPFKGATTNTAGLKTLTNLGSGNSPLILGNANGLSGVTDGAGQLAVTQNSTNSVLGMFGTNTYTGPTTILKGTLSGGTVGGQTNASNTFSANSQVNLANVAGATLSLNGLDNHIGSLTGGGTTGGNVSLGGNKLTVGNDGTSPGAYAGVISGTSSGQLTKIGNGKLTLSGINTYGGTTTVSAGTLLANTAVSGTNSATGTGAVSVSATATLGGTGQITPTGTNGVSIASGGFIAPGASIGTLTFNLGSTTGHIVMNGSSGFKFELGAPGASIGTPGISDMLVILNAASGDLAFSNNTIDFLGTATGSGFYKLFDTSAGAATWGGTPLTTGASTTGGKFITGGLSISDLGYGDTGALILGDGTAGTTAGDIYLSDSSGVPEPSTFVLAALALVGLGLVAWRRRGRGKSAIAS